MGTQLGILPIAGSMDNITFYKSKDGMMVKKQSKISKEQIQSADAFERTRENNSDFGTAAKAGQLLRQAFRAIILTSKDHRVVGRLLKLMLKAVQADAINPRGKRNVIDGELEKLQGFDFNPKAPLSTVFTDDLPVTIDRVTGVAEISIPSFTPGEVLVKPKDATHFKVVSAASALDFENRKFVTTIFNSGYLPVDNTATGVIDVVHQLPANSSDPLFLLLGIQFYMLDQGVQYPLKTHEFNALRIVGVSTV